MVSGGFARPHITLLSACLVFLTGPCANPSPGSWKQAPHCLDNTHRPLWVVGSRIRRECRKESVGGRVTAHLGSGGHSRWPPPENVALENMLLLSPGPLSGPCAALTDV